MFRKAATAVVPGGVFHDPDQVPRQFLHIMASAASGYTIEVAKVLVPACDPDKLFGIYLATLDLIVNWSPEVKATEINKLLRKYPYVEDMYVKTYAESWKSFGAKISKEQRSELRLSIPVFREFFYSFLCEMAKDTFVRSLNIVNHTYDQWITLCEGTMTRKIQFFIQTISLPQQEQQRLKAASQAIEAEEWQRAEQRMRTDYDATRSVLSSRPPTPARSMVKLNRRGGQSVTSSRSSRSTATKSSRTAAEADALREEDPAENKQPTPAKQPVAAPVPAAQPQAVVVQPAPAVPPAPQAQPQDADGPVVILNRPAPKPV